MPIIFSIGFTQLFMLGWLAAAAAPLIIHLWNKRKYREVSWAAMEYLLAAVRKNSRRVQIEQWLLLATRTAIIVLVVLAVAGPFLKKAAGPFLAGQSTHKVLVIDSSFSMGYKPTDKSRFDRAKELAAQIVEQSAQGDGFTLVLMTDPPRVIVGTPAFSPGDFLEEIENLRLPHGSADLPATLVAVEEIVARGAKEHSRLARSEVYFLTDLGRNTWSADLQAAATRLAQAAGLVVVDLGQTGSENLAISELRLEEPYATVRRELHFAAQVTNFGRQPRRLPLEWWVDGERVKEEFIDVPAGGTETLGFDHAFESAGEHNIEVKLLGDALDIDSRRWLALPVREFVEVLVINGDGTPAAANYLLRALNPEDDPSRSPIRVQVASESALAEADLSKFDAVFLSNVSQFTGSEAQLLSHYVRGGGGLVMFLGDRVQAERYNQELGGLREGGVRLLPALLDAPTADSQFSFDPLAYRHPIVAEFAGNERSGLLTTPISRYFKLKPRDEANSRTRIAMAIKETGDAVMVEEMFDAGRVVLLALPASLASVDAQTKNPWTMMPAWHSFLPLVQESLAFALGGKLGQRNMEVGQTINVTGPPLESLSVIPPTADGRAETVRIKVGREGKTTFGETWQSGLYRFVATKDSNTAKPASGGQMFAVNVNTGGLERGESNLVKIDPVELPREFVTLSTWQNLDERPPAELATRSGLHRWFLYAALGLMFFETALAWWIGYKTKV